MKRFYKSVSIERSGGGYHILLDGRPVKTKSKAFLCAMNEKIAALVMDEWENQKDEIVPNTMPFTQILNTYIDRVSSERSVMSEAILKYLDTDLLCYQTDQPQNLVSLQQECWQPFLDGFEKAFNCTLLTTTTLSAVNQSSQAHEAVEGYVHGLDDARFTVLQLVTSISGSLILALAMVHDRASANSVLAACFVEEDFKDTLYNAAKYGEDPMLKKSKKAAILDLSAAEDFLALL